MKSKERWVNKQEEAVMEATELGWPNVKYFSHYKDHPALKSCSVEDSSVTPGPSVAREEAGRCTSFSKNPYSIGAAQNHRGEHME